MQLIRGVPWRSVLGQCCAAFVSNVRLRIQLASSPQAPSYVVHSTHWREGMPSERDLERLERYSCAKPLKNKADCKVPYLGQGIPVHKYLLGQRRVRAAFQRKLKIFITAHLQPRNHILVCIKISITRRWIFPLWSALVRPHREYCIQLLDTPDKKDVKLLG